METQEQLQAIFRKYLSGEASDEEIRLMMDNFHTPNQFFMDEMLLKEIESVDKIKNNLPALPERIFKNIKSELGMVKPRVPYTDLTWFRAAAAAVITLILGVSLYFYLGERYGFGETKDVFSQNDIKAGSNKATLILPDGTSIKLSDLKNGIQTGREKLTYSDGTLVGKKTDPVSNGTGLKGMISIVTPRGGTYQVTLPDGTSVILNSGSTLKFPSTFDGSAQRMVQISGEAYFEVVHNKKVPFRVKSDDQIVEVLGTHFNINSYKEEPSVKTTLLQGSVKVLQLKSGRTIQLHPGEQSVSGAGKLNLKKADLAIEMAWKNGEFIFTGNDFRAEMRNVARWYNVDIVYDQDVPQNIDLRGFISRGENLSAVLRLIELTGKVHFSVEGRRVSVTK